MKTQSKSNRTLIAVVAVVAICMAVAYIFRTATAPRETINRFEDITPKGAGKFDRK
jgi:hypothetical protein